MTMTTVSARPGRPWVSWLSTSWPSGPTVSSSGAAKGTSWCRSSSGSWRMRRRPSGTITVANPTAAITNMASASSPYASTRSGSTTAWWASSCTLWSTTTSTRATCLWTPWPWLAWPAPVWSAWTSTLRCVNGSPRPWGQCGGRSCWPRPPRATLAMSTVPRWHCRWDRRHGHLGGHRRVGQPEGRTPVLAAVPPSPCPCHLSQLLRASSPEPGAELGTVCLKAGTALLASIKEGAFQNVLMISQLLPVLNRKTYLDLIHPECQAPRVMLVAPPEDPAPIHDPATISVTLKVNSVLPPYKQAIAMPAGSSLEDVLKKAQKLGGFTYGTQASLSGPYLTSVKGKPAGHREFWQLLRDPDTPLQQGIADYRPQDGETVELRLVSW
uniref:Transcobalamin-2 n=1 Tax=Castor canadensis TaxID=51338 RepID=A0A8C0XRJ2_CASCN